MSIETIKALIWLAIGLAGIGGLAAVIADGVREGEYDHWRHRRPPRKAPIRRIAQGWAVRVRAFKSRPAARAVLTGSLILRSLRYDPRALARGARGLAARWRRPQPAPVQPAPPAIAVSVRADVEPFTAALAAAERQVAELRLALTEAERWPELQPRWRDSTDAFPAYIEATGGF